MNKERLLHPEPSARERIVPFPLPRIVVLAPSAHPGLSPRIHRHHICLSCDHVITISHEKRDVLPTPDPTCWGCAGFAAECN